MREYRSKKHFFFLIMLFLMLPALSFAQTAQEIIRQLEKNLAPATTEADITMRIKDQFGTKVMTLISYSRGEYDSLIEFTNLEDAGAKILRNKNEIYLYYPDAEELIRMQGAALKESMMGSDVSYEDLTGNKSILDNYDVSLQGEELVDGNPCYKIELVGKNRDVPYAKQIFWVDKKLYINRQIYQFSVSGKLLKELQFRDIRRVKGLYIGFLMIIRDKTKKDSSTEMTIDKLAIDIPLDPKLFSLEELTW